MRKVLNGLAVALCLALLGATVALANPLVPTQTGTGSSSVQTTAGSSGGQTGAGSSGGHIPVDPPVPVGHQVTLNDSGSTVHIEVGERLLLMLGDAPWQVRVADPSVLAPADGPLPPGATAAFVGKATGQTEVTAVTDYPCRKAQPPCMLPDRLFQLTVIVSAATPAPPPTPAPALALVHGTVVQVLDGAVVIRTPDVRPVCRPGEMCAQFIIAGRLVRLDLAAATFFNALGEATAAPPLRAGDQVAAAGRFTGEPAQQPALPEGPGQAKFAARAVTLLSPAPPLPLRKPQP